MELNNQPQTGTGENICFSLKLTTSRIGNLDRLIHTLLNAMTIHSYIHTYVRTYIYTTILWPVAGVLKNGILEEDRGHKFFSGMFKTQSKATIMQREVFHDDDEEPKDNVQRYV